MKIWNFRKNKFFKFISIQFSKTKTFNSYYVCLSLLISPGKTKKDRKDTNKKLFSNQKKRTHIHTCTHTHTHTQSHTQSHTQTHRHTETDSHKYTETDTDTQTRTHTQLKTYLIILYIKIRAFLKKKTHDLGMAMGWCIMKRCVSTLMGGREMNVKRCYFLLFYYFIFIIKYKYNISRYYYWN